MRYIVERPRQPGVALTALATHGAASLGRTVYGRVPGLPVRQPTLRPDRPRVLIPLDGSAFAEAVLPMAALVALATRGVPAGRRLLAGRVADAALRGDNRPLVLVHLPAR